MRRGERRGEGRVGHVPSSSFLEILRVKFIMETCSTLQLYNLLSCNGF